MLRRKRGSTVLKDACPVAVIRRVCGAHLARALVGSAPTGRHPREQIRSRIGRSLYVA